MSRRGHFELWTGLSGDMFVGACLDAGWPEESLVSLPGSLGIAGLEIRVERRPQGSLTGLGICVSGPDPQKHRHLSDIEGILDQARLDPEVRESSLRVFRRLAEAEARIHGTSVASVHFHEVGALDAIVDIVAATRAVHELGIERLSADPVPLHRGWIDCEHGRLPSPAPATSLLLQGWPVRPGPGEGEWTTPTGAALLSSLAEPSAELPALRIESIGFGAGQRTHPTVPNLTRLWIGEEEGAAGRGSRTDLPAELRQVVVLEAQVDDMTGEEIGHLAAELRASGVLDVTVESLLMKKGRPGVLIRTILRPEAELDAVRLLFRESSTLGVRTRRENRWERFREVREVTTPWGPIRVKYFSADGKPCWSAEFDDLVDLAGRRRVSLAQAQEELSLYLRESGDDPTLRPA